MTTKFDVENLGPGGRYAAERVADIADINASSRVLEIGAGHGVAALHLAGTRDCRVVATDKDLEKLERLQRRVLALRLEGHVDASRLDCTRPFPHSTGSFDLVMAGSVLDRVDDMTVPVDEAFRVLRSTGFFAVWGAVWKRESRDPVVTRTLGKNIQSLADYELLLTQANFRIAASRLLPDHLWADYYRQFVDVIEYEMNGSPDLPLPWSWYEEAAIVLTHLDVVGIGLVVGQKEPPQITEEEIASAAAQELEIPLELQSIA